jgi:antitoxin MazE
MRVNIIKIGNSKGIRLSRQILTQCNIDDQIDLEIADGKIIIRPIHENPRKDWGGKFKKMKLNNDDKLIIDDSIDLEMDDWAW